MAIIDTAQDPHRFQCRHLFTDGHRCGSPCLRHEQFCFYHHPGHGCKALSGAVAGTDLIPDLLWRPAA